MKKILLFLSVASGISSTSAQSTIEKYYLAPGGGSVIELPSHDLLVGMSRSSMVNAAGTSLLDPQGNFIRSHTYAIDTVLALQSLRRYTDNDYYFTTGYHTGPCTDTEGMMHEQIHPVIGRMDSLGNVSAVRHYEMVDGCQNDLAGDLEVTQDGGAITWGREWGFFALKVDHDLAHVWSKHFNGHGCFQFIRELPGGDLLVGINLYGAGVAVARLDADGNFLWCKSYIRPRGVVQDCVIEGDDSFLITGYTDSIASTNGFDPLPPDFHPKLFLMKLDGTGTVQWCKGYESATTTWYTRQGQRITKASDGGNVLLANLNIPGYNLPTRPFLMKTDMNGDTLWTRSVGKSGYNYWTHGLLGCSDGGILYSGVAYGAFGSSLNASFLFKTDSLGHLPCFEVQPPVLTVSDLFPTDSSFTLTSVDGALALPAHMQDTTYDAITVYDGCDFTTGLRPLPVRKARVYPNPSAGRFTVEFKDPLMAESYYSVYDALGKLLYQRPLPTGAQTEEVDLSRFGQGTYLLKFTDPTGVCYERVVVE